MEALRNVTEALRDVMERLELLEIYVA